MTSDTSSSFFKFQGRGMIAADALRDKSGSLRCGEVRQNVMLFEKNGAFRGILGHGPQKCLKISDKKFHEKVPRSSHFKHAPHSSAK
jgi:hypothetical protein